MKKLFIGLLSVALLCSSVVPAFASWELEGYCDWRKKTLSQWVNDDFYANTIIVGTVTEVKPKINQQQDSSCWARFSVSKWLKGSGSSEMWVNGRFLYNRPTLQDIQNLQNCQFKEGDTYIVYGHHSKLQQPVLDKRYFLPSQWIATAWNKGMPDNFCAPNERLYGSHPSELDKKNASQKIDHIQSLIQKGK